MVRRTAGRNRRISRAVFHVEPAGAASRGIGAVSGDFVCFASGRLHGRRFGGLFHPQTNTKLRGHVGRGYRAPSLYERFGSGFDSFFGYTTYGDPRLESEHSIAFDAGIDQSFGTERCTRRPLTSIRDCNE